MDIVVLIDFTSETNVVITIGNAIAFKMMIYIVQFTAPHHLKVRSDEDQTAT